VEREERDVDGRLAKDLIDVSIDVDADHVVAPSLERLGHGFARAERDLALGAHASEEHADALAREAFEMSGVRDVVRHGGFLRSLVPPHHVEKERRLDQHRKRPKTRHSLCERVVVDTTPRQPSTGYAGSSLRVKKTTRWLPRSRGGRTGPRPSALSHDPTNCTTG
jgi:hypothetical protein